MEKVLSLVGKVNYFWGGKSSAIGWDPRWGTLMKGPRLVPAHHHADMGGVRVEGKIPRLGVGGRYRCQISVDIPMPTKTAP